LLVFAANTETQTLISKSNISGPAIRSCVNTSGGVRRAATIKIKTIAILLLFLKNWGFIIFIFVRKNEIMGS